MDLRKFTTIQYNYAAIKLAHKCRAKRVTYEVMPLYIYIRVLANDFNFLLFKWSCTCMCMYMFSMKCLYMYIPDFG